MTTVLAKWMTLFLTVNIMFAPILAYMDSLQREAVEVVLTEGAKEAAIQGRFTTEIISNMKGTLADKYSFTEDDIKVIATTTQKNREEYLEASIEVPRTFIFILDVFSPEPLTFKKSTKIMSEKLS